MTIDSLDSELGVRFRLTDEQLIRYLIKCVASKSYICNYIEFEDLYGSKKPWELLEDSSDTKYFFTKLKKLEPHHTRFIRTLIGGGSWKGKGKGKPPMQTIESGYVGCDDEKMNDMTTQPQWPIDDHQLSQLIVTLPMVQGNGATMNEGNINGELVVPEQLSTYQEEQVQNVEETAGSSSSDYQVDPTFTGVLNNDECLLIDELGDFDNFMGENQEWLSELVS
ncbi:hypothetical protein H5410_054175 [Solanum commersonii]|uniref:NAC domain-containing protein n=1 Tax=Solanum commersonii TaxID=4109 RepID=A0A9J5X8H7_SOLCO|nr:hypothetical protein H5410_054175 [Solanum commersonii]